MDFHNWFPIIATCKRQGRPPSGGSILSYSFFYSEWPRAWNIAQAQTSVGCNAQMETKHNILHSHSQVYTTHSISLKLSQNWVYFYNIIGKSVTQKGPRGLKQRIDPSLNLWRGFPTKIFKKFTAFSQYNVKRFKKINIWT